MKRSASKAELSLEQQEEPLEPVGDAVEPIEAGLGLELRRAQEQGNVGERSIEGASGAVLESTQAGLVLESYSIQNVERGAIWGNSGVAGQPTQAGLGLESQSFLEQPNVEERFVQASTGIVVQPTQAALSNLSNLEGISMDDFHDLMHPSLEERDILEEVLQIARGQTEALHQEEVAGINDRIVSQASSSDTNNLRSGLVEPSQQEEEAVVDDRLVPETQRNAGLIELANSEVLIDGEGGAGVQAHTHSQQMHDVSFQQGMARRRMRLQLHLGGANGLSEPKCVPSASSESTCMCGGISLEQRAKFLSTEPADFLHGDATCSSARVTMQEEGDTKEPLSAKAVKSGVTKSDVPAVAQQITRDVSSSSSNSLVHLLVGLLGDACILPAFGAELSNEMEKVESGSEDSITASLCSEMELKGRQFIISHSDNTRPYPQQRMTLSGSSKEAEITKLQHELPKAVPDENCRKPSVSCASGVALCLLWIATLALILLCLFRSFHRLTRTAFASV